MTDHNQLSIAATTYFNQRQLKKLKHVGP